MSTRPPGNHDEPARRARAKLTAHRGLATWGERLVPLAEFRRTAAQAGHTLSVDERLGATRRFLSASADRLAVEGPYGRIVIFGGVYNNHHALAALLEEAARLEAEAVYCLGDFGGFGPHPNKVWPLLAQGGVLSIQGNYEESLASGATDCACGYTDPRDNHFAALSYGYTERHTAPDFKRFMGTLPKHRRVRVGDRELLLVHGSPRRVNEFLFRSTSPVAFLEGLVAQSRSDGILCTHTGLHWHRRLPSGADVVNVGAIGRPANDGRTAVWYAVLEADAGGLRIELKPLVYDHQALAAEMASEELPAEFIETVETGWWTTCLEILPPKERAASKL